MTVLVESHPVLAYFDASWGWAPDPGLFRVPPMAWSGRPGVKAVPSGDETSGDPGRGRRLRKPTCSGEPVAWNEANCRRLGKGRGRRGCRSERSCETNPIRGSPDGTPGVAGGIGFVCTGGSRRGIALGPAAGIGFVCTAGLHL